MVSITATSDALASLGRRLREARIARDEPMRVSAERIGVSVPTLRAMEQGADTVAIKHWANALWALDRLHEFSSVLAPPLSLLDRARLEQQPRRQRASRRRA